MALSHNSFIRGFNSIYQQAPRLEQPADRTDFVGYCLAWIDCVLQHHHYEETEFFPNLNKAAGQTGLMANAVHEHEAFYGGMERLKTYLLGNGANFASVEVIRIMDSFKEPLYNHLKAEPGEIVALASYSTVNNPIDILGIADAAGESKPISASMILSSLTLCYFLRRQETGQSRFHVQHPAGLLFEHGNGRVRRWHLAWRLSTPQGPG